MSDALLLPGDYEPEELDDLTNVAKGLRVVLEEKATELAEAIVVVGDDPNALADLVRTLNQCLPKQTGDAVAGVNNAQRTARIRRDMRAGRQLEEATL